MYENIRVPPPPPPPPPTHTPWEFKPQVTSTESSKVACLLLFIHCLLLLQLFVGVLCFVMQYMVLFLVLQSSRW